ncbi:pld [Symbiodinium sp. CCMP2592]|nr:pld [Symbiodinium sp. CCMP2592]
MQPLWLFLLPCLCHAADLRLLPDWDHAPFLHGVASADPLSDRVLIWTRVSTGSDTEVVWRLWREDEESFDSPFRQGIEMASAGSDFAITVDVSGLDPSSQYLYQFSVAGNRSMLGRTRTAGSGSEVNLAIVSCTSLWSGYFNFYRQLAFEEVDAVVHLGDLVYERPDPDELLRVPGFHCDDVAGSRQNETDLVMDGLRDALCHPSDLVRYRALQSVHMFDPDFRLARARHPFLVIYDNHDVNWKDANSSLRAFREWVPMRGHDEDHALEGGFRHFRFGEDVVDVYMLDTAMASTGSLLGREQEEWLKMQLQESSGTWRLFASPKTFMPLALNKTGASLAAPVACVALLLLLQLACCRFLPRPVCVSKVENSDRGDMQFTGLCAKRHEVTRRILRCCSLGACCAFGLWSLLGTAACAFLALKFDRSHGLSPLHAPTTTWEGQPGSRNLLFDQLQQSGKASNNIWAVGDMHFSYLADVFRFDYLGKDLFSYSPQASVERYGVEFMPGSGSRGNMDEKAGELLGRFFKPPSYLSRLVGRVIDFVLLSANPQFRHFEGSEHGYGLLKIARQKVQASWARFDVLRVANGFTRVSGMHVNAGDNKWSFEPALLQTTCPAGL